MKTEKEKLKLFMEDGSLICEDEDLKADEVTGGKLLILAENFSDYRPEGKCI